MSLLGYITFAPHPFLVVFYGTWGIRFYPLAYITGFFISYYGLWWQAKRGWSRITGPLIDDLVFFVAFFGVIAGGRLGYCLFYGLVHYLHHPLEVFYLWRGGMASHGGILGVILVLIFFSRYHKMRFYHVSDAAVLFVPLDLALGRIANFMNGELWGRPTDVPWGIIFTDATPVNGINVPRHPSQLYEAGLEGFLLEILLLIVRFNTRIEGTVSLTFMLGYSVLRIIGEQFREPDLGIGYLYGVTEGQILSFFMLAASLILIAVWLPRRKRLEDL